MNKKTLLLSSLLAVTLLAGCEKEIGIQNGNQPVGAVDGDYKTKLEIQDLYESLKTSQGGEKALEKLLDVLFENEYANGIKNGFTNEDGTFNVREYRTNDSFVKDINDQFQEIVDGNSYVDDDGKFDVVKYVESINDHDHDHEVTAAENGFKSKYLSIPELAGYNFDAYIEEDIIPDLYEKYFYEDYLLGSNKYKGQFANQYAMTFEVLKIDNYTTAENSKWTESMIRDVKAVTTGASNHTFSSDYSFVTSNSDNELIVFTSSTAGLTYSVYADKDGTNDIETLINKVIDRTDGYAKLTSSLAEVVAITGNNNTNVNLVKTWTVNQETKADATYFEQVEELLIARKLYNIDQEVIKASNANQKNDEYKNYTETEKSSADGFLSTYTSSNSKSIVKGAKSSKITAQNTEYYTEEKAYTKGNYGNVLPSSITSLRGTTARELQSHLLEVGENGQMVRYDATASAGYGVNANQTAYLLPYKENLTSPVYLDSNYYYIVKVSNWYGYYIGNPQESSKAYKSLSNYQIEAYQNGEYKDWSLNEAGTRYEEAANASKTAENQAIIDLVQASAESILTSSMKKEAVVDLFEKYGLTIHEQDVYDYIKSTYPDYFSED